MGTAELIFKILEMVFKDVKEWIEGRDSVYDYGEFAKRAGGKFESEILLEREKNRLKNKPNG